MAAGLALHEENFPKFAEAFCSTARELLSEEALQRSLRLDHELPFTNIDVEFLRWHELLQPFGNGNPQPLFFARAVEPVGRRESQTKSISYFDCAGRPASSRRLFRRRANEFPPPPWDVAFRIGRMNMTARLWLACGSRACAQPEQRMKALVMHPRLSNGDDQRFDKP
jgi:single-stranded-DNA-specific exonuclease